MNGLTSEQKKRRETASKVQILLNSKKDNNSLTPHEQDILVELDALQSTNGKKLNYKDFKAFSDSYSNDHKHREQFKAQEEFARRYQIQRTIRGDETREIK